ncbi:sensor histidine kinase [Nocardioides daphniae]|uniref:Sensor-like histidine kinase SenX3 n=1 Tax=Nocardioides daphniae TaxID=402297 RepID=A0A4P7UA24_9ACTN|nr:HAMP domain-containing sensor histidine kinase [Nocardioides daphniae]QCC76953.1 HAMP domain-containing histidine kinase [Nocardioides daphniae]
MTAQCRLARVATGATAVAVHVTGRDTPLAVDGDPRGAPEAGAVDLVAADGVALGRLVAHADGPVDQDLLEVAAGGVVAHWELEAARNRLFDLEDVVARGDDQLAQASGQIVHDLNNPLAAIAMCLEIAREQVEDGDLLASLLDRAAGSAERMKRMTVALNDYGQRPVAGVTDLADEVPALLREFEPLLDEVVEVVGPLPTVALSPGDVRTVLTALWENATKFRDEDSDLEVTVTAEPVRESWRVAVTDNGRGIDEADLERVFAPTVRLDKRVPGMGLGLAAVRRIVAAAGGRVGAERAPGGGTTVWFEVPGAVPPGHSSTPA